MGQKANPNGMRLGIIKDWKSRYYPTSNKQWSKYVVEDKNIRNYFKPFFKKWSLSRIEIDRTNSKLLIGIFTAKPGIVLGQDGNNVKLIKKEISKIIKDKSIDLRVEIKEVERPNWDAKIIADEIATQLENRVPFRIAQKRVIGRVMRSKAKGIKTSVSGRLNGVDMARTEGYSEGEIPLQTLRNDIDYAVSEALTTYGIIGVKVWISRGSILENNNSNYRGEKTFNKKNNFDKNNGGKK